MSSFQKMRKVTYDEVLEESIKCMRDLRMEMIELKRFQKPSKLNILKGPKRYVKRCM